ncbi:MAG: bifunctional MaoC family dehydratase N-terminal/OB-fold nucleic acid binding domain-containing protein [Acidimicrobiales bacterium]
MTAAAEPATPRAGDGAFPDHGRELAALVGAATGPPLVSPVAVNRAMVHHWVEAMDDRDPVYVSDEAARAVGLPGAVAPPAMLQAWVMRGLRATLELESARAEGRRTGDSPNDRMMALLDDEGMTSVVATNCEQHYDRPLVAGDRLVSTSVIEAVSDVKRTALGTGRFVTTRTDFVAVPDRSADPDADPAALVAAGQPVGTMRFRILKYRPGTGAGNAAGNAPSGADAGAAPRSGRPRPAITQDNAFFFEGARRHRLLAQRCTACGTLRHPPLPACGTCRSFEWEAVELSGRGELFSFVVVHYPRVSAFDYPLPVGLVALEEGTRLVADLEGLDAGEWRIGMPVEVGFVDVDEDLTLPVFRPAAGAG